MAAYACVPGRATGRRGAARHGGKATGRGAPMAGLLGRPAGPGSSSRVGMTDETSIGELAIDTTYGSRAIGRKPS
jgi:hypothetical protein